MKKLLFICGFLIAFGFYAKAQTTPLHQTTKNANVWFMYFGDHKFSDKWGLHLEAQVRRNEWGKNWQQLLLRTGLNYHFSNQVFGTVGYCFVKTYPYGAFPVKTAYPENRFWEQIQVKNQIDRFELVNRFRFEQRLSKNPVLKDTLNTVYEPGDAVYTNRARILNRVSIPFKGKQIVDKSLYFTMYDEVFVNFGKKVGANIFDQNRAYLALGYKIPNVGRLEIGYLYQVILKSDGIKVENNHTLQVGLSSNINFYKNKK